MAMERILTHCEHTDCYTYFCIKGNFDPDEISEMLGLVPNDFHKIGDKRNDGTSFDFALWEFGRCDSYEILVENQMIKTVLPLISKTDVLLQIKQRFNVSFTQEVVSTVRFDEPTPCLAPSLEVMKFCCDTGTDLDIDLSVSCPDDYEDGYVLEQ